MNPLTASDREYGNPDGLEENAHKHFFRIFHRDLVCSYDGKVFQRRTGAVEQQLGLLEMFLNLQVCYLQGSEACDERAAH